MPKVSIIIPVFNVDRFLKRCIESILAQTYIDFELLLIDDGSTDNSGKICDYFADIDQRIRVFHKKNEGVSIARNTGIKYCTGEYITFIDSDDYITSNYLESFSYCSRFDMEAQGIKNIYHDSNRNSTLEASKTITCNLKDFYIELLHDRLMRSPVSKIFKSNIIKAYNILFPEHLSYGEDAIFVKNYLLKCDGECRIIKASGYCYTHFNVESLTSKAHSGFKIYEATIIEYALIQELLNKLIITDNSVIQESYESVMYDLYWSIYLILLTDNLSIASKHNFLENIDKNILLTKTSNKLPITFNSIAKYLSCFYYKNRIIPLKTFILLLRISVRL